MRAGGEVIGWRRRASTGADDMRGGRCRCRSHVPAWVVWCRSAAATGGAPLGSGASLGTLGTRQEEQQQQQDNISVVVQELT